MGNATEINAYDLEVGEWYFCPKQGLRAFLSGWTTSFSIQKNEMFMVLKKDITSGGTEYLILVGGKSGDLRFFSEKAVTFTKVT